jgi:hypothetical protein
MTNSYTEPISKLLSLGEIDWDEWVNYPSLGFTREHVPELLRMGTDKYLMVEAEIPEFWAPYHAWRALAQLLAENVIDKLVQNLDFMEAADTDWFDHVLIQIFVEVGPVSIPSLAFYLIDTNHETGACIACGETLGKIGKRYPEAREQAIGALVSTLELFDQNDGNLNGFILSDLLDLHAVETLPVIRRAFTANAIDITIAGDLEDAEIELGLRTQRSTPSRIKEEIQAKYPGLAEWEKKFQLRQDSGKQNRKKEKNKHKQEKKSRQRKLKKKR